MITRRQLISGGVGLLACSALPACGAVIPVTEVAAVTAADVAGVAARYLIKSYFDAAVQLSLTQLINNGFKSFKSEFLNSHPSGTATAVSRGLGVSHTSGLAFAAQVGDDAQRPVVLLSVAKGAHFGMPPRSAQALTAAYNALLGDGKDARSYLTPTGNPTPSNDGNGFTYQAKRGIVRVSYYDGPKVEVVCSSSLKNEWVSFVDERTKWWLANTAPAQS